MSGPADNGAAGSAVTERSGDKTVIFCGVILMVFGGMSTFSVS